MTGTTMAKAAPTPCSDLAAMIDAAPAGPVFLASYPTAPPGPLGGTAFLYDNAAAAIALVGCGETAKARRIGEAFLFALDHDRFWHDGRLRNAYAAGPADPLKLPGWWDAGRQAWLEDRYQVASDSGNMAWTMLALLTLDQATGDDRYRSGAARIGGWVAQRLDKRGAGGFTGGTFGHEPDPAENQWKSTEHNTDLVAAFARLAKATGDGVWKKRADAARHFIEAMWREECSCFAVGSGEDGVTPNPIIALDAQVWPPLALPAIDQRIPELLAAADQHLRYGAGYAYSDARDGMWTEGTAQVALLQGLAGHPAEAAALLAAIGGQRAVDGGYFATSVERLPTGFTLPTDPTKPRLYFRLPHLGATAWAALAATRFNPFTGTRALPVPAAPGEGAR